MREQAVLITLIIKTFLVAIFFEYCVEKTIINVSLCVF